MPDTFIKASNGELFVLNGVDPVISWNGVKPQASLSRVETPKTVPTMSSFGVGALGGEYYCYVRFVAEDGTVSNLSPLSSKIELSSKTGLIADVSQTTPIVIESVAHGLAEGQTVSVSGVGGEPGANGTFSVSIIDQDFFILNNSETKGVYSGGGKWLAGASMLIYSNVPVPTDEKIKKRQILRNTNGQVEVFYVDFETENLTAKSFFSKKTDEELADSQEVPLYDADMNIIANGFPEIPDWKPYAATINDRMFIAGAKSYTQGSAKVQDGNAYVYGIGTNWKENFAGRKFFCSSAANVFDIAEVDEGLQRITLAKPYSGKSNYYDSYSISPNYAEKKALYYSEVGEPKRILTSSGLVVQEDNEEITGLVNLDTFLYIFFKSKIYKLTFGTSPDSDGAIYPSSYTRGALNQRCIVTRGSSVMAMDRLGIYAFQSSGEQSLSTPIGSIFAGQNPNYKINWKYSEFFHAVNINSQNTVRWFVVMGAGRHPRHALCFNYETKVWWIEEFSVPVYSSCQDFDPSAATCFLGINNNRVVRYPEGNLDGIEPTIVPNTGSVSSSSHMWFDDASMTFDPKQAVNNPVCLRLSSGELVRRVIKKVVGSKAYVDRPFLKSVTGSTYTIGSAGWSFRTGNFRIDGNDKNMVRKVEFVFQPTKPANKFNFKIYKDREEEAIPFKKPFRRETNEEFTVSDDGFNLIGDFSKKNGSLSQRIDTHRDYAIDGTRYISLEVNGDFSADPLLIYGIRLDGIFHAASGGSTGEGNG